MILFMLMMMNVVSMLGVMMIAGYNDYSMSDNAIGKCDDVQKSMKFAEQ